MFAFRFAARLAVSGLLLLAGVERAAAQSTDNILLVINETSPASVQIGEYYRAKRAIPQDHIVRIKVPIGDSIARKDFETLIQGPVGRYISKNNLQDRILYLVLTKDVPLRISGANAAQTSAASVDSELTLLYRQLLGQIVPTVGRVDNPYFLGDRPLAEAKPFTHLSYDIYLVTRLDGFTVDDVLKLIDRGLAPSREGKFVFDQKSSLIDRRGDDWLQEAADRLRPGGASRVVLDTTTSVASTTGPVLGYYSWGSNDPAIRTRQTGLQFAPGAIAGMFVSTDGRTFTEPPADWLPGNPNRPTQQYRGSDQSLAGDLIREGVTGVAAQVAEPLLDALTRPQVLFPAYLAGFNLVESYYLAMPFLSWETVVVGDPLCSPFSRPVLPADQLYKGLDNDIGLPAMFMERRLAVLVKPGFNRDAMRLMLKADVANNAGNDKEVEALLVQATLLEPRLTGANLRLGATLETRADFDGAADRYRKVLAVDPNQAIALNNLAYILSEHQGKPQEALPLAERAYRLAPTPNIGDTLGWIQHLLGEDRLAAPLVEKAMAALPDDPEMLMHAAAVHAALGDKTRATKELDAAVKIDPKLAERADVKALRDRIKN